MPAPDNRPFRKLAEESVYRLQRLSKNRTVQRLNPFRISGEIDYNIAGNETKFKANSSVTLRRIKATIGEKSKPDVSGRNL